MFKKTTPQLSLLEAKFLVNDQKRSRLERSWAQAFREQVLPRIDEEAFRSCFCADNGRPNTSIRMLVGLHLLKEADDLTDEQILDALEFNLQWQHALGVQPADAHVCEKTLHNFRHLLARDERASKVYADLTAALMKADGLSAVRQRLDSTHVLSNIAVLSRLGLFTETVTTFLRELRRDDPAKLARLDDIYARRYLDREGYFSDVKRDEARRRLPIVGQDLYELVRRFENDELVRERPSYQLLVRLLAEQCTVVADAASDAATVTVKEPTEIGGASLQSPHDPDATYGHKGKGYEVQLAETCVETNPYEVVTAVSVNGANVSDQHATVPIVETLAAHGHKPDELIADTAYGGGENIVETAMMGVSLIAPVQGAQKPEPTAPGEAPDGPPTQPAADLGAFRFNATFDEIVRCPAGAAPLDQSPTRYRFEARFSTSACATCPLASTCASHLDPKSGDRTVRWRPAAAATATRQREQQERQFKQQYKLRSGIESTNAEFKSRHGGGKLRVRGRDRVIVAVHLKALALNVKRAVQHHTARLQTMATTPGQACEAA